MDFKVVVNRFRYVISLQHYWLYGRFPLISDKKLYLGVRSRDSSGGGGRTGFHILRRVCLAGIAIPPVVLGYEPQWLPALVAVVAFDGRWRRR